MAAGEPQNFYPDELFRRPDESDDSLFYTEPRLVVHVDDAAIAAISAYFHRSLPHNGVILDLMSSWRSHMPSDMPITHLIGIGMNSVELRENPQLHERIVHNLNADPKLPLEDCSLDAAVVTVSIQYMIKPVEVFREINRALKPRTSFHVIYSNRMFPTKAVAIWQTLDDRRRAQLIVSYFRNSGGWENVSALNITPKLPHYTDPVYVVTASKTPTIPSSKGC